MKIDKVNNGSSIPLASANPSTGLDNILLKNSEAKALMHMSKILIGEKDNWTK